MEYQRIRPVIKEDILYWVREEPSPDNLNELISSDAGIISEQLKKGIPDRALNLPNGSTVFDLGAHLGSYCLPLAKARSDYKIFAFEPQVFNYGLLVRNIIANRLFNVTPLQFAVGVETGIGNAIHRTTNTGSWTLKPTIDKFEFTYSEPFYILSFRDAMMISGVHMVDYVKFDIESIEYDVISSIPDTILKNVSGMEIEIHNDSELFKMSELLSERGFQYRYHKKLTSCWDVFR